VSERGHTRAAASTIALALCCVIGCALGSCDDGADTAAPASGSATRAASAVGVAELGEGVALEIGDVALLASEVEMLADTLALVYPEQSRPALLRRALVDVCLPRAALAIVHREERERALAAARNAVDEVREGRWQNVPATLAMPFAEFDVPLQAVLREAPAGAVVGPVESAYGTFNVALVKTPFDPAAGPLQEVVLDGWSFAYLDPEAEAHASSGQAALDGLGVRFASETWRDLVPLTVQARLGLKQ
jgi:hypothetical protein